MSVTDLGTLVSSGYDEIFPIYSASDLSDGLVIKAGQIVLVKDTASLHIADGLSTWAALKSSPSAATNFSGAIKPTGVAATDTANIQAVHDALPATGGEIRLGAGTFVLTAAGITLTKRVKFVGVGKSGGPISVAGGYATDQSITRIEYPFGTGNAITVSANCCVFQDFHLANTNVAAPTAGAGIVVSTGYGVGFSYRSISVAGFYNNIDHANGFEWTMDGCTIYDWVRAGLRIANPALPDGGDMGIDNCQFISGTTRTAATAGIEWISSGGLRVTNCKFNERTPSVMNIGIYIHPADGITTSVFQINDNSFENMAYGIYSDDAGNTGTGVITKINIKDNEFLCSTRGINLSRTQAAKTSYVQIKDNLVTGTGGIAIDHIANIVISGNLSAQTGTSRLSIGTAVTALYHSDTAIYTEAGGPTTGTAVLNGTTPVVIPTTFVSALSVILLTQQVAGGTQSGIAFVVSRIAGTSFTIASVAGDTSTVGWQIIEPLV